MNGVRVWFDMNIGMCMDIVRIGVAARMNYKRAETIKERYRVG